MKLPVTTLSRALRPFPVQLSLPLHWGELDAAGSINTLYFAKFFEAGRRSYYLQVLKPQVSPSSYASFAAPTTIGPILKSCQFEFFTPVPFDGPGSRLEIGTRIKTLLADRFVWELVVLSNSPRLLQASESTSAPASAADGYVLVARGEAVSVMFDYSLHKKALVPSDIADAIRTAEQSDVQQRADQRAGE
ncbi:uncharacterized protein BJ171DRAFT_144745 [Polychytrium aggregatum]|uniref:uncharacterized protein n=1 Tax=Polychytrium aggregatum TaxID=110093 RepID=UPI0022FF42B3|nr:uncharacterized protein BJ171DRAFT_144745 [Polychytrium aggregatum]KAI9203494.1 hypothetical protein BJ171DRAFT_144745 [Polychytrium aggregatum]